MSKTFFESSDFIVIFMVLSFASILLLRKKLKLKRC